MVCVVVYVTAYLYVGLWVCVWLCISLSLCLSVSLSLCQCMILMMTLLFPFVLSFSFFFSLSLVCADSFLRGIWNLSRIDMVWKDSTFLHTEPLTTIGMWIALEDCTEQNGCLSFIPGSHKGPLARRFLRTADGQSTEFDHPLPAYPDESFVPLPASAGELVSPGLCYFAHVWSPLKEPW
jgi:hypothetical protein